MLKAIHLTNFKRHESLAITFDPGTNAICGDNAVGKTSLLTALRYALGAGIPGSKDNLKTWGAKKPMEVRLVLDLPGYPNASIERTERNATVYSSAGEVLAAGHTAVNAFIEERLGITLKDLRTLMVSSQGETQELLDLGATKLEQKVGEIAKSQVIDQVLKRVTQDISFDDGELAGIDHVDEVEIAEAQHRLLELDGAIANLAGELPRLTDAVATARKAEKAADGARVAATRLLEAHARAEAQVQAKRDAFTIATDDVTTTQCRLAALPAAPTDDEIAAAKQEWAAAQGEVEKHRALLAAIEYMTPHLVREKKQLANLKAQLPESQAAGLRIVDLTAEKERLGQLYNNAAAALALTAADIVRQEKAAETSICAACNRPFDEGEHQHAKDTLAELKVRVKQERELANAAKADFIRATKDVDAARAAYRPDLESEIAAEQARIDTLEAVLAEKTNQTSAELLEVFDIASQKLAAKMSKMVEVKWAADDARAEVDKAVTRAKVVETALALAVQALEDLDEKPDLPALEAEAARCREELETWVDQEQITKGAIHGLKQEAKALAQDIAESEVALQRWEAVSARKEKREKLVTFLRKNRGKFMVDIWAGLLAHTSALLASVTEGALTSLTRTSEGVFQISEDGRNVPVAELSGGQKSLVGVCMRIALSHVFYGHGLPLLLDEPAADLKDHRAAALAGLLSGTGSQVVMVTHRTGDSAMANQVIEIGG